MTRPTTAREALIAEALGEVAALIERVDALTPTMNHARASLEQSSVELLRGLDAFETRMKAITENAKTRSIEHIARRTDELARHSLEQQTLAMRNAARTVFAAEMSATVERISAVQALTSAMKPPWATWLAHAATAAAASAVACGLTVYALSG